MKSLAFIASSLAGVSATIKFAGVAESSGEFGLWSANSIRGTGLPGRFGVDYAFINQNAVNTFVDQNRVNLFRVAFSLERMCPLSYGLGARFNETHFNYYKQAIDYITVTKGAYAILDPHNYMRYNDPSQAPMSGSIIGDTSDRNAATTQQFAAFWGELANRFKDNEKVMFGIMNEPHDMATQLVFDNNQAAVTAIRNTGAKNLILVPGNNWSGGHSWTQNWGGNLLPNSDFMHRNNDSANNWVLDIHEYLDFDFSGSHTQCVNSYPANMAEVTAWLRSHNLKAMVTEFGGSNAASCTSMVGEAVRYMESNSVYIGWTAWAAGPFWGTNSPCCTDSQQLGSLEPGSTTANGSPSLYQTVWLAVIQPLLPRTLQWSGRATAN